LGAGQTLVSIVVLGLLSAAVLAIGLVTTGLLLWIALTFLALVVALLRSSFEWTRVVAVTTRTRHVGQALSSAVRLIGRHPGDLASTYGLMLALMVGLYALYRWVLTRLLPLTWWLPLFGMQQAFVLASLWVRLARLAGGVVLATDWLSPDQGNEGRGRV
jgi:hypothetical protein